jgi:hypothetical protein
MASPLNHDLGWDERFVVKGTIGPNRTKDDGLRHWVHWVKTDNPRSLYDPVIGYRRQAEWDDHGEAYPLAHEGPDLWISVKLPDGIYRVSLYFFNKDGHDGMNRCRDYLVQLKRHAEDWRQAELSPTLASSRVHNFWGGVYPKFIIAGPGRYSFKIAKNGSFNTFCGAVFIDRLRGAEEWWDQRHLPFMENVIYRPPSEQTESRAELTELGQNALALWTTLNESLEWQTGSQFVWRERILSYRAAIGGKAPDSMLKNWRWTLPIWNVDDRQEFNTVMRRAWEERLKIDKRSNSMK